MSPCFMTVFKNGISLFFGFGHDPVTVIPAKAGIQEGSLPMDSGFRRNDGVMTNAFFVSFKIN